jgi:diguanylate cyclase (GGDEF)-like protein
MSVETWASSSTSISLKSLRHQQRRTRVLPALIVGLIVLVAAGSVFDVTFDRAQEVKQAASQLIIAQVRLVHSALLDTENGLQRYVASGRLTYLDRYLSGIKVLTNELSPLLPQFDKYILARSNASGGLTLASHDFEELRADWDTVVRRDGTNEKAQVETASAQRSVEELIDRLRGNVGSYLTQLTDEAALSDDWSNSEQRLLAIFNLGCSVLAAILMVYAFRSILKALGAGFIARHQVEQLFFMADMLQSAAGQDDTNEVLHTTSANLLPGFSGALYVFNNSRDRLDLATSWGTLVEGGDHISPTSCWALKRGKPHLNEVKEGVLRCNHAEPGRTTLEIPMAARGQLYGLLTIGAEGADAPQRLNQIQPIATAMGDALSLALSSIDLRERLRNLALRDSLTGLYNRRFLEEMLARLCADAERRKTSISAIMMDLDHFKKLNDQYGHAAGDAVLRDVAAAILSCLRSVDVACRYGGEEFAVLLPDCSAAAAAAKAEQIRSRVSERTTAAGAAITISLGVASISETCVGLPDLLPTADEALYAAKQQGRDRVIVAPLRPSAQKLSLIDAG